MADMRRIGDFFSLLDMVDCHGHTKTRIGGPNDGGYAVLDGICRKTEKVLSFGIGDDVSFELEFTERYPQVDSFTLCDPTITSLPETHDKFKHIRKYASQLYPEGFKEHTGNSLLKVDIEWSEWELLKEIDSLDLNRFSQILIELHLFHVMQDKKGFSQYFGMLYESFFDEVNVDLFSKYEKLFGKLIDNFYIFHIHANNSLPKSRIDAWSFPPLIELSLVRKDLVGDVSEFNGSLPTCLDSPNKTDRPDVENYFPVIGWNSNGI